MALARANEHGRVRGSPISVTGKVDDLLQHKAEGVLAAAELVLILGATAAAAVVARR